MHDVKAKLLRFCLLVTTHQHICFLNRRYESTGRAIAVTPASAWGLAWALALPLKFLVKVFINLYLLNMWMD